MHSQSRFAAALATARITAFKPGQSPPAVTTPIRVLMRSFYSLCGEPGSAVFADQRKALIDRVNAMRDSEIDVAGEFVVFSKHRVPSPFNKLGPHFTDQD